MSRFKAALVSLPWDYYQSPSIAVGCLAAYARQRGLDVDALHLHLEAAALFDLRSYDVVAYKYPVVGEAVAAMHVLPEQREQLLAFSRSAFADAEAVSGHLFGVLRQLYEARDWSQYQLVGFTVHFAQLFASVLFATWLKQDHPSVRVVFGGGCVTEGLARSVLSRFPALDWCHRGDGEEPLVALLSAMRDGAEGFEGTVPGLAWRDGAGIRCNPPAQLESLEALPDPDYDNYFSIRASHPRLKDLSPPVYLPVEASRGCLHRCAFCNFNAGIDYRPRPAEEVAASMRRLSSRYRVSAFCLMALMIPVNRTEEFFKAIRRHGKGYQIFCEGRANLSKRQLAIMKHAGVTEVQIGIEALNTPLLRKMRKGTRLIDNLQVMKFCEELGIRTNSFLLLDFPTETQEEVDESVGAVDFACAYAPLSQVAPFTLREGSPVDRDPEAYGLYDVRTAGLFSDFVLGTCGSEAPARSDGHVNGIDYWYKSFRSRLPPKNHDLLHRRLALWTKYYEASRASGRPLLGFVDTGEHLAITDRRRMASRSHLGGGSPTGQSAYVLSGWEREAYLACDSIRDFDAVAARVPDAAREALQAFLDRMIDARLMFGEDGRYLSLAFNVQPSVRQGVPFPWI